MLRNNDHCNDNISKITIATYSSKQKVRLTFFTQLFQDDVKISYNLNSQRAPCQEF